MATGPAHGVAGVALERELKLAAGASFAVPDLSAVPGVTDAVDPPQRLVAVYYDTPGLHLARWGITLRRRDDAWTLKLPAGGGRRVLSRHEVSFAVAGSGPPAAALDAVAALLRGEHPVEVATIVTARRRYRLAGPDGRILATLADDLVQVHPAAGGAGLTRFRELELELDPAVGRGLRKALARRLRAAGARRAPPVPKLVLALGPDAASEPEPLAPELDGGSDLRAAVRAALAGGVRRLLAHEPAVRLDLDPEAVHQARAATRQLRALLRAFAPVLGEADRVRALRGELGWLGDRLGAVRDADVLAARLRRDLARHLTAADGPALEALLAALAEERAAARDELVAALHEARSAVLIRDLVALAVAPDVADGDSPASSALRRLLGRRWRRLARAVTGLPSPPADADLHAVRIRAKECRYLAEAATPVVGRRTRRLARSLAALQDVLGRVQDGVVAEAWLRRRGRRLAGGRALAAGQLVALARQVAADARTDWPEAWSAAARHARCLGL